MSTIDRFESPASLNLSGIIAAALLLHVGFFWALQAGLLRHAVEIIIPAEIISDIVESRPVPPPEPARVRQTEPSKQVVPRAPLPVQPRPLAIDDSAPAVNAPIGTKDEPIPAPVAVPLAPPAPPRIELPSTDADYLQNPKPTYPTASKRLNEQGKVMLRVLIGTDGAAQKTELARSSGYERLDRAALETVQRWRFVPGKRNGVAETMWFNVPINFVLE